MPINRNSFPSASVRSVRLLFSVPALPHSISAASQCPLHGSIGAKAISGQAKPTSRAHSTATMRASFALISAFAAAMSNTAFNGNTGVASAQRRFSAGSNIVSIRSCDEFPGRELDVTGTVTFLREINCSEPTVRGV